VREFDGSSPTAGSEYLAADSEGLTIYPLPGNGRGYLLASSQGSSTFIVYDLASLEPISTFAIVEGARTRLTSQTERWSSGSHSVPSRRGFS
jgi:3-phytase